MNEIITPFDIAEHLETEADIQAFLLENANTGEPSDFIHALNIAARAKGMTEVAKLAGVTRSSLYKSLADNGNPKFETISKICTALGVKLHVEPLTDEGINYAR
ncbi:MAG: addiction module antidote protein [Methylococcales bacterium]